MAHSMKELWKSIGKKDQKEILQEFFFDVLLNMDNLPEFMTENDSNDMIKEAVVYPLLEDEKFCMILDIETFAYRYWRLGGPNFWILIDFLKGLANRVRVGNAQMFERHCIENMKMWFDFNMQAVYLWLFQHQQVSF